MNCKTLNVSKGIQILLFRDVNDNVNPIVKIYAYWEDKEGYPCHQEEEIIFDYTSTAQAFISDFSEASALKWFENNVPEDEE